MSFADNCVAVRAREAVELATGSERVRAHIVEVQPVALVE